jgi:hypothetical protein
VEKAVCLLETRNSFIFQSKYKGKTQFVGHRSRWESNAKMDLKEIGFEAS